MYQIEELILETSVKPIFFVDIRNQQNIAYLSFFVVNDLLYSFLFSHNSKKWKINQDRIIALFTNIKNASGPYSDENGMIDLVDFLVGSEGIFGVIKRGGMNTEEISLPLKMNILSKPVNINTNCN